MNTLIARRCAAGSVAIAIAGTLALSGCSESADPEQPRAASAPQAPAAPERAPLAVRDAVSKDRLIERLRALPTDRSARGDDASRAGLVRTQDLVERQLQDAGYSTTREQVPWAERPRRDNEPAWYNIIAELPGTTDADEILIVGAHFDAVPGTPGADDNGTGTAALLEIAEVLRDRPMRRTIRFCLFNLEEVGLIGSTHHAHREVPAAIESGEVEYVGMLSLEMLGYFSDEPGSQQSPLKILPDGSPAPTVGDFITVTGVAQHQAFSSALGEHMREGAPELKVLVIDQFPIAPPDFLRSDHAPFLFMGVPAVMVGDTSNFRNPHYHKATDTVESLDLDRYTMTVRALAHGIHELAGPVVSDAVPAGG